MALFVLCKPIFQTHMRSHPVGLDVWFFSRPFIYFHTLCMQTASALARLCKCPGLPEPLLVAYVISTIISWADSKIHLLKYFEKASAFRVALMSISLRSGRFCRMSRNMMMRKSDKRSLSCISSKIMWLAFFNNLKIFTLQVLTILKYTQKKVKHHLFLWRNLTKNPISCCLTILKFLGHVFGKFA